MNKIRAVIFDLDGVIVSTDQYHYLAWKEIADKLGIPFDEEVNNLLRGVSRGESLEIILRQSNLQLSKEAKLKLTDEKNERYKIMLQQMSPADVGADVHLALLELKAAGLKLAIGSSSKNARTILTRIGLLEAFDAISDGNNITMSKPDPEVFLKASQYVDVPPAHCIIVEDAEAGIEAGRAAGMLTVAIGSATGSANADFRIISLAELPAIIAAI